MVLTTTVFVALALIAGTTVSVWQAIVARRARAEAVSQRDRARTGGSRRASQRDRAEANYQKARDAVDKLLTEVGQVSLKDVPQMEPVRRRLLESALQYYQGFLQQQGDVPPFATKSAAPTSEWPRSRPARPTRAGPGAAGAGGYA